MTEISRCETIHLTYLKKESKEVSQPRKVTPQEHLTTQRKATEQKQEILPWSSSILLCYSERFYTEMSNDNT